MFKDIENLKIETIIKATTKMKSVIPCRITISFILYLSGIARYSFEDYYLEVGPGDIIFMPRGVAYEFNVLTDYPCEYVSIRFEAELCDAHPAVYSGKNFQDIEEFSRNLPDMWKFGGKMENYRCYAVFYNLLSYIENLERLTYSEKRKISVISPAIEYLKLHIYDTNLKTETLYKLCGISGTYFRKIFQANFAVSPQKYILSKRLSYARAIIDIGDFNSVSEIAYAVG